MKKQLKKIITGTVTFSAILLASVWVYAAVWTANNTMVHSISWDFNSTKSRIWELINTFFDADGFIKPDFIKPNSITETEISDSFIAKDSELLWWEIANDYQKKLTSQCSWDYAIQKINQNWSITCVKAGSGTTSWFSTADSLWSENWDDIYSSNTWNIWIWTSDPWTKLHINSIDDVEGGSSANGVLMIWPSEGVHISIDNNEIMSKHWDDVWVLHLQHNGGDTILWGNIRINWRTAFFWNQSIYWDNSAKFYITSNHDTSTQLIFRDKQNKIYWRVYWDWDGSNFGILDWDSNWSYRAEKDKNTMFYINNSEKMRIKSNWRVWIWTGNPANQLHTTGTARFDWWVAVDWRWMISGDWYRHSVQSTNNNHYGYFNIKRNDWKRWAYFGYWNGSDRVDLILDEASKLYIWWWNVDVNWKVYANEFIYRSDRRLKKNIKTLDSSLEKINKMRWVRFEWKKGGEREIWLIAQEVEKVYPDLVTTDTEKNADWIEGIKAVKYGNIVAILIEGVKELYNKVIWNSYEIEKLKTENTELKNKLNSLENKMESLDKKINKLVN